VLDVLEAYYDAAPRPSATTEAVGPFTLFVRSDPALWHYYARPRLGLPTSTRIQPEEVARVRARQRQLGAPEAFEWVHESTPSLLGAARADGLAVARCPLLILPPQAPLGARPADGVTTEVLTAGSPRLPEVMGAIGAGFAQTDDVRLPDDSRVDRRREQIRRGLIGTVAAYDEQGNVLGGGSHGPRGTTTELAGIAVLPRARRRGAGAAITVALAADARARGLRTVFLSAHDDTVARVYERVGFVRVGTACIAEPPEA
jgi:N-acetylglutamate synthase-like GNAT family acetyltransferase